MGPVQVLVVGFDRPVFSGEVMAEFARLREAGIVRLADLLLVRRAAGGTLETLTAPPDMAEDLGRMAAGDPAARPADRPPGPTTAEELR